MAYTLKVRQTDESPKSLIGGTIALGAQRYRGQRISTRARFRSS